VPLQCLARLVRILVLINSIEQKDSVTVLTLQRQKTFCCTFRSDTNQTVSVVLLITHSCCCTCAKSRHGMKSTAPFSSQGISPRPLSLHLYRYRTAPVPMYQAVLSVLQLPCAPSRRYHPHRGSYVCDNEASAAGFRLNSHVWCGKPTWSAASLDGEQTRPTAVPHSSRATKVVNGSRGYSSYTCFDSPSEISCC
jgi:hypothetical protein